MSLAALVFALAATLACSPARSQPTESRFDSNYYSPATNLERLDWDALNQARRVVDISMYSFTDKFIAEELVSLATRGVHIRLYRDREQFASEQSRRNSTTDIMRGIPNVEIRVKRSRTLMHLKAFCVDGELLRDGSANWSAAGLKRQDNNARYTNDPAEVQGFEANFEEHWSRPNNEVVQ